MDNSKTLMDMVREIPSCFPHEYRMLMYAVKEKKDLEQEMKKRRFVSHEMHLKYLDADGRILRYMHLLTKAQAIKVQIALNSLILQEVGLSSEENQNKGEKDNDREDRRKNRRV